MQIEWRNEMRLWLKACPRCAGDLQLKPDIAGSYVECIQCGLELNRRQVVALVKYGFVPEFEPMPAPRVLVEGRRHSA